MRLFADSTRFQKPRAGRDLLTERRAAMIAAAVTGAFDVEAAA